jgi:hypothetical protein
MGRRTILRIHCRRRSDLAALLILALLVAASLGYLLWAERADATPDPGAPQSPSARLRRYYVTSTLVNGSQATLACEVGYHMASLWEMVDPSNLKYDTSQPTSLTYPDSGQGPPAGQIGWVRTGYFGNSSLGTPGLDNCDAWTSNGEGGYGTYVSLVTDWNAGGDVHVWKAGTYPCNWSLSVWCVEDVVHVVFIPVVTRSWSGR